MPRNGSPLLTSFTVWTFPPAHPPPILSTEWNSSLCKLFSCKFPLYIWMSSLSCQDVKEIEMIYRLEYFTVKSVFFFFLKGQVFEWINKCTSWGGMLTAPCTTRPHPGWTAVNAFAPPTIVAQVVATCWLRTPAGSAWWRKGCRCRDASAAFSSGYDLRVLGWSPTLDFLLIGESASLSLSLCLSPLLVLFLK